MLLPFKLYLLYFYYIIMFDCFSAYFSAISFLYYQFIVFPDVLWIVLFFCEHPQRRTGAARPTSCLNIYIYIHMCIYIYIYIYIYVRYIYYLYNGCVALAVYVFISLRRGRLLWATPCSQDLATSCVCFSLRGSARRATERQTASPTLRQHVRLFISALS